MKRLSMFVALACLGLAVPMCVQADDNYVTDANGTTYKVVGENLVTNGDFSDGLNDWLGGDGNALSSDYFTVSSEADETTGTKYVTATVGDGGSGDPQSIVTLWSIDPDKTYYFSCWTKNGASDNTNMSGSQSFLINDNNSSSADDAGNHYEQHILYFTANDGEWLHSEIVFKASDYAIETYAEAEYSYAGLRLAWLPKSTDEDYPFELSNVVLYEVEAITPDNGLDITSSKLINPDFAESDINSANFGWTGDLATSAFSGFCANTNTYTNGDASLTNPFFEAYNNTGSVIPDRTISQKVTLPAGEYRLAADVMAVKQDNHTDVVTGVYLFADDEQTSAHTYNALPETYTVDFAVEPEDPATTAEVEVGLKIASTDANWVGVDNFKLYYLGSEYDYDYFELSALITEATELYGDGTGTDASDLKDAIDAAQTTLEDEDNLTSGFADAISSLQDAMKAYQIANASEENPLDMTDSMGAWTGNTGSYGTIVQLDEYYAGWNVFVDKDTKLLTSTITGLPEGTYEVEIYCEAHTNGMTQTNSDVVAGTDNVVTIAANDASTDITFGTETGDDVKSLDTDVASYKLTCEVDESGELSLSITITAGGCVNWVLVGNKSLTYLGAAEEEEEPDEPEETVSDDEYEIDDIITIGKAQYKVTSENLFTNGGFNDGVNGWTASNDYMTDAVATNFTLTEEGGFNGGAYMTTTAQGGSSAATTATQAIKVTEGSTYVLLCHTSGTTPDADNLQYNGLFNLTYDETTEAFSEDNIITEFNWNDPDESGWTLTAGAFKAKGDYVGVKMALVKGASFDGFQLYEVEPVEIVGDTEYSVDDVVEINGTTYTIKGENLVQNGGFEEEDEVNTEEDTKTIPGWTSGSGTTGDTDYYQTSALAKNFTITDACGFNGKQFITEKNDHGINNTDEITQAVEVESSKTYLFIAYTSGKTPTTDEHIGYSGLVSLTYESGAYTEGSYITNLNWGTAASSNNNGNTVCWWTETDKVFEATTDYVGIRLAWTTGSFDGFQLYEVEQTTFAVSDVEAALDEVTVPEANIGTEAFQYDEEAVAALQTAYDAAEAMVDDQSGTEYSSVDCYAAIVALQEAAEAAAVLNEPEDGQVFNIILKTADTDVTGNALESIYDETKENGGKYDFQFSTEPNANLAAQLYTFTPVEDVTNGYTISFVASDGETYYFCAATEYDATYLADGIRATDGTNVTADNALTVVVKATDTEGVWNLYNPARENNLGLTTDGKSLAGGSSSADLALTEAPSEIEWTLEADYGTLMLPFVPTSDEIDGLTFYSTSAYGTEPELSLEEVETLEANTPYIVSGDADTYTFAVTARSFDTEATAGWLTGVYEETTVEEGNYVLQNQTDEGLAFYIVTEDAAISLGANHCYLTVTSTSDETTDESNADETNAPAVVYFPGSGKATAITGVEANVADAEAIYDLSGRKVSQAQKGIYIKGGKKVVIK